MLDELTELHCHEPALAENQSACLGNQRIQLVSQFAVVDDVGHCRVSQEIQVPSPVDDGWQQTNSNINWSPLYDSMRFSAVFQLKTWRCLSGSDHVASKGRGARGGGGGGGGG